MTLGQQMLAAFTIAGMLSTGRMPRTINTLLRHGFTPWQIVQLGLTDEGND